MHKEVKLVHEIYIVTNTDDKYSDRQLDRQTVQIIAYIQHEKTMSTT